MFSCVSILTLDYSFGRNQNSCGFCNFRPTPPVTLKKSYWRRELLDWGISKTEILSSMLLVRQMRDLNAVKQTNKSGCTKMTHTHRTIGQQTSKSPRVAMLLDVQNVSLKQKQAELLLDFATSKGRLNWLKIYYNSQHDNQVIAKENLEKLGFKGIDVPDSGKNSADIKLVFDCTKLFAIKPCPEIIILVLGDRDFAGLIALLMASGKTVIVFARRKSASKKLIKLVGEHNFHYVDELSSLCAGLKPQLKNPKQLSIEADRLSA